MSPDDHSADSQEREALRATVSRLAETVAPIARSRTVMEADGHDGLMWARLAELGITGLLVPSEFGGSGATIAELAVVIDLVGERLIQVPLAGTSLVAAVAIDAWGTANQRRRLFPDIADGNSSYAVVCADDRGILGGAPGMRADTDGSGHTLVSGDVAWVPYASTADRFLIAASDETGVTWAVLDAQTPGMTVTIQRSSDPTRPYARVRCDRVSIAGDQELAAGTKGADGLNSVLDLLAIGTAIDSAAGCRAALAATVSYAKSRHQFGRPIGSFQAVKHHCANMYIASEQAGAAVRCAIAAFADGSPETGRWAAIAQSTATQSYLDVTRAAVQVHGGIGFTWEHDIHLYLKRARMNEHLGGGTCFHRARLARDEQLQSPNHISVLFDNAPAR